MSQLSTTASFPEGWVFREYNGGMKFRNQDTIMARITPCLENGKTAYIDFHADNEVAFGSTVPGSVVPVNISQGGLICQKGAFLCAEQTVDLKAVFTKKFMSGLFGGEGFILQHLFGQGMAFLEVDGDKVERYLNPGEVLKVDTGNVVAFEPTVNYEIETVKGLGNIFLGGEGLFLTRLTGPGKIILQTQNFNDFAGRILSMGMKK